MTLKEFRILFPTVGKEYEAERAHLISVGKADRDELKNLTAKYAVRFKKALLELRANS